MAAALAVAEFELTLTSPALKVAEFTLTVVPVASRALKVAEFSLTMVAAVRVVPLSPVTVEPETVVTYTAELQDGSAPDSWLWRRVSGASVGLTQVGATVSFKAPSAMPPAGATVVLGVTATRGAVVSSEQQVTVTVLPQTRWTWDEVQGRFVGRPGTFL